jgi:hypothetical protein
MVVVTSVVGGMILGNLLSIGQVLPPFMSETSAATTRAAEVGWGLAPVMLLLFLGLWLL